ncbi:YdeI/OmpD-associated family protein [Pontibacter silvestris]|uniref:YdeI/OmpD-associated family protein n=1 Tax=Pontibacter silvestris TaxID=2305183 RepID=A0ABW4X2Z5_9BACT|nr:YdeI/OmpD-associated family protein [Pontibacter silvestris]MCC9135836.1 YdeI/OmpD-associated family protein [Pontibacter silvestris]
METVGYEVVRQISVDDMWSFLRFKHQSVRKEPSKYGTDMPEIERKSKTVIPPDDLLQALEAAGLGNAFQNLSFIQRKEYSVAVLEARRPETRANRIQKAVEQLRSTVQL